MYWVSSKKNWYCRLSFFFWPLYCLSFDLRLLITLWYIQTFGHCIVCPSITTSDYPLVYSNFWPLYCLFFDYNFWLPFGIFKFLAIVLSVLRLQLLITLWYIQTFFETNKMLQLVSWIFINSRSILFTIVCLFVLFLSAIVLCVLLLSAIVLCVLFLSAIVLCVLLIAASGIF